MIDSMHIASYSNETNTTFYLLSIKFVFRSCCSNEIEDVNDIFPKLSAYLQLASNSALKGSTNQCKTPPLLDIKQSPPSSPSEASPKPDTSFQPIVVTTTVPTSSSSSLSSTVTSNGSITSTTATSKISLVPTNILMKPSNSQSTSTTTPQFSFKPQQFLCAKSGVGTTTSPGGMPMKVLLVNTLSKPTSSANCVSVVSSASTTQATTVRPIVSIQPKTATSLGVTSPMMQNAYRTRSTTAASTKPPGAISTNKYLCSGGGGPLESNVRRAVPLKAKGSPGFRTLLNQLVQMQSKQLDVSRQRLEIERERLDYEKSVGDKILTAITTWIGQKESKEEK